MLQSKCTECRWFIVTFVVMATIGGLAANSDVGFEKYFVTNLKEVEDYPINFRYPLPKWLKGTLARNGLGRFEVGDRRFTHAFDSFAKLNIWKFPGNGSAFYSTKFVLSDFYKMSVKENTIYPYLVFSSVQPPLSTSEKLKAFQRGMGNMNVNIYQWTNFMSGKHEYVILNDCWNLYKVNPFTLQTLNAVNPRVPNRSSQFKSLLSSAHPLKEPGTDNYIDILTNLNLFPFGKNKIQVARIKSAEAREQIAEFKIDRLPYIHSFSVTQNYVVVFLMPFFLNLEKLAVTFDPLRSLDWSSIDPIIIKVINIKSGKVRTLKTENGFFMHHINSFEIDESKIVVDISVYETPDSVMAFEMNVLHNKTVRDKLNVLSRLTRYVIDLNKDKVTVVPYYTKYHVPLASRIDMPNINENYRSRKYCFAYGTVPKMDDVTFGKFGLAKKDLCGNSTDLVWYVRNHYPAEAWFVPFPDAVHEDDGYLLTPVFDAIKQLSYLTIIDARTMKTINHAHLPFANPMTTHGRFFFNVY